MSDNENPFSKPQETQATPQASMSARQEIPVELVTLPSKGSVYPIGHPLSNEETVEIKAMTAREEDLLTSRALIRNGTVITKLLKACVINKLINPDDMLAGDRNALLIGIRVTGYGSDYAVKISCPECEKDFENTFSLNGLALKRLSATPIRPNTNLFEFRLPGSRSYSSL